MFNVRQIRTYEGLELRDSFASADIGYDEARVMVPVQIKISQNYPNPFNAQATINFALPKASFLTVEVYNLLGRSVAVQVDNELPAGYNTATWDASDLTSGM